MDPTWIYRSFSSLLSHRTSNVTGRPHPHIFSHTHPLSPLPCPCTAYLYITPLPGSGQGHGILARSSPVSLRVACPLPCSLRPLRLIKLTPPRVLGFSERVVGSTLFCSVPSILLPSGHRRCTPSKSGMFVRVWGLRKLQNKPTKCHRTGGSTTPITYTYHDMENTHYRNIYS